MNESPKAKRSILALIIDGLSSFGLSCCLLIMLLYLTWRGTLAQVELGLKEAQARYFDAIIARDNLADFAYQLPFSDTIRHLPDITLYLPGAYLVLAVLVVNLILGGIIRIRKSRATLGVLIAHFGILIIVAAGVVKFHDSDEGYVDFAEGESVRDFVSYYDWEIAIREYHDATKASEWIIPQSDFGDLRLNDRAIFQSNELPFDLEMRSYSRNSQPTRLSDPTLRGDTIADGFALQSMKLDPDAERNAAGCIAVLTPKDGSSPDHVILWGGVERRPFTKHLGGKTFTIDLRKKRYPLPFALRLEKFHSSTHPGIMVAKDFSSDVTRIEGPSEHAVKIKMNEPMRAAGHIFYQAKYREAKNSPDGMEHSILAVVRNPSDRWPLIACIVIACGLVLHFGDKLIRYARSQFARRSSVV